MCVQTVHKSILHIVSVKAIKKNIFPRGKYANEQKTLFFYIIEIYSI